MSAVEFSKVEKYFVHGNEIRKTHTNTPYIIVDNFPLLGFLTALRFLEWVSENPCGVISLPTGKTPEYFILWTAYLMENWNTKKGKNILGKYDLHQIKKPDLKNLQFVQIDEFYPIRSSRTKTGI